MNSKQESKIQNTAKDTIKYLYNITGDVTPKQYEVISTLRQLINECYVQENKQVGNQFIYDQLKDILELKEK